jgi:TPR repeat protein
MRRTRLPVAFCIWWVVAVALGAIADCGVLPTFGSRVIAALIGGAILAGGQWLVLRDYVDWAVSWALATMASSVILYELPHFLWTSAYRFGEPVNTLAAAGRLTVAAIPQCIVLYRHARRSGAWLLTRPIDQVATRVFALALFPPSAYAAGPHFLPMIIRQGALSIPGAIIDVLVLAWIVGPEGAGLSREGAVASSPPITTLDQLSDRAATALTVARSCLAFTIVAIFVTMFRGPRAGQMPGGAPLVAILAALPYGVALVLSSKALTRHVGLTLSIGCAVLLLVMLSPMTFLSMALVGFATPNEIGRLLLTLVMLLAQVVLIRSASLALDGVSSSQRSLNAWPIGIFVPAMYMIAAWSGVNELQVNRSTAGENARAGSMAAHRAFDQLHDCAVTSALAHPEHGVPATLESLGPQGDKCAGADIVKGTYSGYRFEYAAGPPDEQGVRRVFSLCARPAVFRETGWETFVADETSAKPVGYAIGADQKDSYSCGMTWSGQMTSVLKHCATTYAAAHSEVGYPAALADMKDCLTASFTPHSSPRDVGENTVHDGGDRHTYIAGPRDARGLIATYEIHGGRVLGAFGGDWRQTFADESGLVHHAQNRLASRDDPTQEQLGAARRHDADQRRIPAPALERDCESGAQDKCYLLAELALARAARGVSEQVTSGDATTAAAAPPQAVRRDLDTAERLDGAACRAGIAEACVALGRMYTGTKLTPFSLDHGEPYYKSACDLGDGAACGVLGTLLQAGAPSSPGFYARQERAATLHARGCELGRADSCFALAEMLTTGEGISRDASRVATLLERGCIAGSAEACYRFATRRDAGGNLILGDAAIARRLMLKACAGGDFQPCKALQ